MFNVNFLALINWLLPSFLRQPTRIAWLLALSKGLRVLYADFIAFRAYINWRATITGQVNRLRQALRQQFNDPTIEIITTSSLLSVDFLYRRIEEQPPITLYRRIEALPYFVRRRAEYTTQYDFIVRIPPALASQAAAIYAFTNYYRQAGKRFAVKDTNGVHYLP